MNTNKLKNFTKKYGFYLAVGVVSIGAMTAVFLTGDKKPNNQANTGEKPEVVATLGESEVATDVVEVIPDTTAIEGVDTGVPTRGEEIITDSTADVSEPVAQTNEATTSQVEATNESDKTEEAIVSETFASTTVEEVTPYFAEGDTLLWPVEGKVIVPYRDDTTKHWFSAALNHTMRTYGVCIEAKEGEAVKSPAKATVIDIVEDSTKYANTKFVGNVGQVVVLDLGNGYRAEIGMQGGKANKDLLGQVVEAGQSIGTVGEGTGPFADKSYNVYVQVRQDDKLVDPTTLLSYHEAVAGVDMGHVAE